MKSSIILVFLGLLAGRSFAQDQIQNQPAQPQSPPQGWYQQQSGTNTALGTIFFLNRDTGWVSSGIGLLKTEDGGSTWTFLSPPPTYIITFVDVNNGWGRNDTSLIRTSDGGKHWESVHAPFLGQIQVLSIDTLRIFNNGGEAHFAGTNDGGKTWFDTSSLSHGFEGSMSFSDGMHGFLCGDNLGWFGPFPPGPGTSGAGFIISADGGRSWHEKYCPILEDFRLINAIDTKHIYVAGSNPHVFYTSDGGNTWQQRLNNNGEADRMFFLSSASGYLVGGNGLILFTNDTGKTWVQQNSTVTTTLVDVKFVDSLTGWVSGFQGTIIHTIDGGKSWVRQYLPFDSVIVQSYPEPAASSLSIHYTIPSPQHVSLTLYDLTGHIVQTFIQNDYEVQGEHTIPIILNPQLSNGAYYYLFQTEKYQSTGKITILR